MVRSGVHRSGAERQAWVRRNSYYHRTVAEFISRLVPPGARVLQLGADVGQVLAGLGAASRRVGVEPNPSYAEAARAYVPGAEILSMRLEDVAAEGEFDYVVLSDALGNVEDVQAVFEVSHRALADDGRLVLTYYNYIWEPFLKVAEFLRLKMPQRAQNWLPLAALQTLLELTNFEVIRQGHFLVVPKFVPILSGWANRLLGAAPGVRRLGLVQYVVARRLESPRAMPDLTCSVIVPCRNEAGTIAQLVQRLPAMGRHTEIVFVEGHSSDNTREECHRVQKLSPDRDITVLVQDGKGKGDAVRKGFASAQGNVLMILDADLSVRPEDLPKFFRAIAERKGDLISGTRLVYPMEREAMRFLNLLANRLFSLLFGFIIGQRVTDTLCGTKALTRAAYEQIAGNRSYFGEFDPFGDFDLLLGGARLNLKITEVPIRYSARTYGATNISRFRHGLLLCRMSWIALRKLTFAA